MNHRALIHRIRDCDLVLSDSRGIQEEAPALGTPLLVLRDKTERPEAIASGNARLIGTSAEQIVVQTLRLLRDPRERALMMQRAFPFGDGRAGPRIAGLIEDWLTRTNLDQPLRLGTGHD
jgi:UDP-N-acetylglucosamine 2-epimerase (non-hydrolysing)